MIPVNDIHMFLKVSYICITMASFTNMRFLCVRFDIFSNGEHVIMVRLCKIVVLLMCKCYNNLECSCKCCLKVLRIFPSLWWVGLLIYGNSGMRKYYKILG